MKNILFALVVLLFPYHAFAQKSEIIRVDVSKPVAAVQPHMWGIFFEDINFAADGGLYAEMVKNRSFEFDDPMMGWSIPKENRNKGNIYILNREQGNNPRYIRMNSQAENFGIINEGFRGMGVKSGEAYVFSILARNSGNAPASLLVELLNPAGEILGDAKIEGIHGEWKTYTTTLSCTATESKAKLHVKCPGIATLDLDMISLFPKNTWMNRPNGLRADLVQLLAGMKPGFIRFPGGCIVEGRVLANRYQWKTTVGDPADRKLIINRWNTEFAHRSTPDYFQSFGLGFFEYFQLSEDLGAEPLPILNCGMACQYNSSELVPLENIDPYVQDALDLIEFANGAVTSKWGALRAKMGHLAPFNLKMIGVGNEQWGMQYIERYKIFSEAIRAKYPDIQIVSGSGPGPDGELFNLAWTELKQMNTNLVDEHYYRSPDWFLQNAARYDSYDRKGPKVFAGEYASHVKSKANNWESALSEAAFMTGLERNAEVVHLASYAPLFAHVDAWQWKPDLIWYDNLKAMGTPNYYVQKMFGTNKGEFVIPALKEGKPLTGKDSLYMSATVDKSKGLIILKIVNAGDKTINNTISLEGVKEIEKQAQVEMISQTDITVENSLEDPLRISPEKKPLLVSGKKFNFSAEPRSFSVISVKYR